MDILRATNAQFDAVWSLLEEYYATVDVMVRDSPEQVRTYLGQEDVGIWLAVVNGEPAGCVLIRPLLPERGYAAECKRLYVRERCRGRGAAGRMLDEMETWALARGLQWIYLDSKDDLPDAIRLYRGRGYVECERYNTNPQATVFLRKRLVK